jgi:hypothetical protein
MDDGDAAGPQIIDERLETKDRTLRAESLSPSERIARWNPNRRLGGAEAANDGRGNAKPGMYGRLQPISVQVLNTPKLSAGIVRCTQRRHGIPDGFYRSAEEAGEPELHLWQ